MHLAIKLGEHVNKLVLKEGRCSRKTDVYLKPYPSLRIKSSHRTTTMTPDN